MFNTKISLYAIMILLSLIANIITVIFIHKNKKAFTKDELIGSLLYENMGIIIGAKLLTYLENIGNREKFDFLTLGLSSYGGLIGAIVFLVVFALQFKKTTKDMMQMFLPSIPLMYSIGKIGCFLAGCCHGIVYSGPLNIVYNYSRVADVNTPYFPIQLVESILFLIIFIYIIKLIKNERFDFLAVGKFFIISGSGKFLLDFLRISHKRIFISTNQIISIVFIIVGVIIFIVKKQKNLEIKRRNANL